jgi:Rieske Fe-S protein
MTDTSQPESTPSPARRNVLQWCAFILGGIASAAMGIPLIGYLFGIVVKPVDDIWIDLGDVKDFPKAQTRLRNFAVPQMAKNELNGDTKFTSAYVRNIDDTNFQVFAINCAHLGCPVEWFPQSGLFMCPCHGGVYYEDGSLASGPPPRGLYEYKYRLVDVTDGGKSTTHLEIDGGHLPTIHAPLRKPDPGAKA